MRHREDNAGEFEARIKNLTSIASSSDSVPYTTVGGATANCPFPPVAYNDNKDASYLCVSSLCQPSPLPRNPLDKARENSTPFPASSGFSFSLWLSVPSDNVDLPLPILTLASSSATSSSEFLALRYFQGKFTVTTSTTPPSPLTSSLTILKPNTWHHISFTYSPPKRLLSKKATCNIHLNAVPSADTIIQSVTFPSLEGTGCYIGHPTAKSEEDSGRFNLGPCLMTNSALSTLDVTCMFVAGPACTSPFWGEDPLNQSLPAIRTSLLTRMHEVAPDITRALSIRGISRMNFKALQLPSDDVIFGFNAFASSPDKRWLLNVASLSSVRAADARLEWDASLTAPRNFAENASRVGGCTIFLPLIAAAQSSGMISQR